MGYLVIRLGVIGLSNENGHPLSFSAIINGYDATAFRSVNWPAILQYLEERDPAEFGVPDAQVSHIWTQDRKLSDAIAKACRIGCSVDRYEEMLGQIDALLLARDDHEKHMEMAMPFLKSGMPVFVDKPLTLSADELRSFSPYLENGKLMSCSGLRYAREIDGLRKLLPDYGEIRLIRGVVPNDWEKYGVHMIDAVFSLTRARPVAVTANKRARHDSMMMEMDDGSIFQLDALGRIGKTFHLDVYGAQKQSRHEIIDNFSAFSRCLKHFVRQVRTGEPAVAPSDTLASMKTLMAGVSSRGSGLRVALEHARGLAPSLSTS